MDITRAEQIALDDALVAPANQLKIDKGMYHKKNADYAYLLWEDFIYQVENKNVKKSNEMYYPCFTKVIINFFMTKDQSILRRNSVNWHYARDDYMFTTIKVVSRHEDTQLYGAILPNELTNEDIRNSKSYKEYYAIASGAEPPKTKARVKKKKVGSDMSKTPPTKGKRLKTSVKADKIAKKKQPAKTSKAKGLSVLFESSKEDDDDEVNVSEDDDDEARQDDVVNEEESDEESNDTSNEDIDEEVQGAIIEEEEMDEEATHKEDESNELYKDVNVNLEGRDTEMIDVPLPNVQGTQVTEDTHVIITTPVNPVGQHQSSSVSSGFVSNMLNPSPDTGIDTIFALNTEATSLVDVLVTTIAEPPLLSATTLPPPPTPLITNLQQTPVPTPATAPSSSLQDLPNFGSLFGFDHRLKTLETDFSEFKQTNQFAEAVSSIPRIVDAYLANKMHEAVKTVDQVKEQVKAQVSKIFPEIDKTVNEQLKAEVMTRSSTESKTSLAIAANLSKLELKKILIDKMESNKSIHRSDEKKNLYKALVDAYENDKLILDTYEDIVSFKRRRDDEDKDEEPSARSNRGSKRRRAGKEPESTSVPKEKTSKTSGKSYEESKSQHKIAGESVQTEEPMHTTKDLEEPAHQEFETGVIEDQHNEETPQFPDCSLAQKEDLRESFNKLMDTPLDFLTFVMNRLKVDTLTLELLTGPTFELMKGSCKSLVELEYLFEEVYKETTEQLDWNNPKGKLTNLTVEERIAFNVSLRMFSRSIVIQRRVEYLQLGVKSYQKKLNITKPDTYRPDLKRREAYTTYFNPRGFIYQNKDKKNRLMRIDELPSAVKVYTNDSGTTLNDRLKGIRIEHLPQTI
ncbi:hypothetical protein Tco_1079997 [Tanacetum coccineum]|uniref:Uncharacterized protein n=1 Tax=Tanacetum coccineum TaxID=301880 RepID=A0ABQ5HV43_9ASTR